MSIIESFTLALALGTDAFSVAMVIGVKKFKMLSIIKISIIIGVFHIIMPLIGLYGGFFIEKIFSYYFKYNGELDLIFNNIGAGILILIGIYMLLERWFGSKDETNDFKLKGFGIYLLALSVSIDALSVGIGVGMMDFNKSLVLLFGVIAGIMMATGLYLGSKVGFWLGDNAQSWGGIALIFLGIHFASFI
jgi:manganese efflux pump family protein